MENHSFGSWLRQQRRQRRLTQAGLAQLVGCAAVTIKKLEHEERRPSPQMAQRLAECLHVSPTARSAFVQAARQGLAPAVVTVVQQRPLLPAPRNAFIGRQTEQAQLTAWLRRPDVRLVTLMGPPGVGKTRLALQVAWNLQADFTDGLTWVDLAPIRSAADIMPTICQALALPESNTNPQDQLIHWLQSRTPLFVLDNCEQVENPGSLIGQLLDRAPGLTLMLTSRIPLDIYGERLFTVDPLPTDAPPIDPAQLTQHPALALFQARAREVQPGFALTADNLAQALAICRALDGLPLAIELAARQLRHSRLTDVSQRIDQRLALLQQGPRDWRPRHQTFRAAITWSLALLSQPEQQDFARLGVFSGSFSAEAAEAVVSHNSFHTLLQASLIQRQDNDRYFMLQTVREYAVEQLANADATHAAHAQFFYQLVQTAAEHLFTADIAIWQQRLAAERRNIEQALTWCAQQDAETGLALATNMWRLWYLWGQYRTGVHWLQQFLAQRPAPTVTRARALRGMGVLLCRFGEFEQARPLFAESLTIAQQLEDVYQIGSALMGLGDVCNALGEFEAAAPYYEEAYALFDAAGDPRCASWALGGVADIAYNGRHDLPKALTLMRQCVALARQAGDPRHLGWILGISADLETTAGHPTQAQALLTEAQQQFITVGDRPGQSYALLRLGGLSLHQRAYRQAQTQLEQACALAVETYTLSYEAQSVCLLAVLALRQQRYEQGLRLYATALAKHRFLRQRLLPPDMTLLDTMLATAVSHLGESRVAQLLTGE